MIAANSTDGPAAVRDVTILADDRHYFPPYDCAVVVREGEIVARGQNRVLRDLDPTAHAEIVALRAAAEAVGNYRLMGCTLYVTLEPCAMCAGAMIHARLDRLVFAAADPKAGAAGSVLGVVNHPQLNHQMVVEQGILAEEAGELLRSFFRERR